MHKQNENKKCKYKNKSDNKNQYTYRPTNEIILKYNEHDSN